MRGLAMATALHLIVIGGYYAASSLDGKDIPPPIVIVTIHTLPQPPSIMNTAVPPAVRIAAPFAGGARANPVMVPDTKVNAESTIATQDPMTLESSTAAGDVGEGGNVVLDIPLVIPSDADPPPFDAVEKLPVPIVNPSPHYPEIALRAGIEGTVWTRVWVTKEGKVRKVEVLKSDSNLLDQAAIDAAAQWVFTPAVMNNGPVPVWMSIPFKFRIRDGR